MSARSLNKVMLLGNLTRDPEIRYTPGGTAVCTFGLATNRSWTPSDGGETQEETEYHRIVAWAKLAEICSQLLFKGRKVYVEGRLQTRKWQGQDGQERNTTEVVIDEMIALGNPRSGGNDYDEGEMYAAPRQQASAPVQEDPMAGEPVEENKPSRKKAAAEPVDDTVDVDDIPF